MTTRDDQELAAAFGLTAAQLTALRRRLRAETMISVLSQTVSQPLVAEALEEVAAPAPPAAADRYVDEGLLGMGAMGAVRRVFDRALNRQVAMKLLHPELVRRSRHVTRFIQEAQTAAQLQHPGVLPIYDIGRRPDGQPYFTMKEIDGQTFAALIRAAQPGAATGTAMRRLIGALREVSAAVGYAHQRGVIHRDLKPDNILIEDSGAVLVVDWGVSRVSADSADAPRVAARPASAAKTTLAGTPAYMAPEQARGDLATPASDVWSIGAVLCEILTGSYPHRGDRSGLLERRKAGALPPLHARCRWTGAAALCDIAARALAPEPADRFPSGAALAAALQGWLDGEARRDQADAVIAQARARLAEAEAAQRAAAEQDDEAARADGQAATWDAEDAAAAHRQAATLRALEAERLLHTALTLAPEADAARLLLAERYRAMHAAAEAQRDAAQQSRAAVFLSAQIEALPTHPEMRAHRSYLTGLGAVTLVTEPPGATVTLLKMVTRRRRLVAEAVRTLGKTPLVAAPLMPGSWLLRIEHPDCEPVRYPVFLRRQEHWRGAPPGADAPLPVPLPPRGSLRPEECYVPPGWFLAGGSPSSPGALPRARWWCHGFVIERDPVTNRRWLAWLNRLRDTGRHEEAAANEPRDGAGVGVGENRAGRPIYHRDPDGRYILGPDPDGDVWDLDWPVVMVIPRQMMAFARDRREQTGQPWRLPADLEWEKAARGVDGRDYPWGDFFYTGWCSMGNARPPTLHPVGAHPVDTSVYGVRGMAGNATDLCLEPRGAAFEGPRVVAPPEAVHPFHATRGGNWSSGVLGCQLATRGFCASHRGLYGQSLRLVRPWPDEP